MLLACGSMCKDGVCAPNMINHSGCLTRSPSDWGSRRDSHLVSSASLISPSVRWRMKTGLPRHLIMTCSRQMLSRLKWYTVGTYVLALGDSGKVDFYLGLSQNIGGCGHVDEEVCRGVVSLCSPSCLRCGSVKSPSRLHQVMCPLHPQNGQLLVSKSAKATQPVSSLFPLSAELWCCVVSYLVQSPSRQARTAHPLCRP